MDNIKIISFLFFIFILYIIVKKDKEVSSDPMILKIKENFRLLDEKYTKIPLFETKNGAFTENKSDIHLCVKNPSTGKYYDINTVMHVALHELAHVITHKEGHGEEFIKNFKMLIKKAINMGIYRNQESPRAYC